MLESLNRMSKSVKPKYILCVCHSFLFDSVFQDLTPTQESVRWRNMEESEALMQSIVRERTSQDRPSMETGKRDTA